MSVDGYSTTTQLADPLRQAELRSSVFTAIDEQERDSGVLNENKTCRELLSTPEGP
jgi:hypothetical protein